MIQEKTMTTISNLKKPMKTEMKIEPPKNKIEMMTMRMETKDLATKILEAIGTIEGQGPDQGQDRDRDRIPTLTLDLIRDQGLVLIHEEEEKRTIKRNFTSEEFIQIPEKMSFENHSHSRLFLQRFGDIYEIKIIKKSYNGQPLRDTFYAFVVIWLHTSPGEVIDYFKKNFEDKGWNVSLAKEVILAKSEYECQRRKPEKEKTRAKRPGRFRQSPRNG